jgi:hypothetical protein
MLISAGQTFQFVVTLYVSGEVNEVVWHRLICDYGYAIAFVVHIRIVVAISLLVNGVELLRLIFSMCLASESSWLDVNEFALYVFQVAVTDNTHVFAKLSNSIVFSSSTHLFKRGMMWGCLRDSSFKYLRALWTFPVLLSMLGPLFQVTYWTVSFCCVCSS